ncbi:hypothetical protein Tco_0504712 [Tanacetum coccineum]
MEEKLEGLVFGTGATMGSKTGVVIGSGTNGGWRGVRYFVGKKGVLLVLLSTRGDVPDPDSRSGVRQVQELELGGEKKLVFLGLRAMLGQVSFSSCNIR